MDLIGAFLAVLMGKGINAASGRGRPLGSTTVRLLVLLWVLLVAALFFFVLHHTGAAAAGSA